VFFGVIHFLDRERHPTARGAYLNVLIPGSTAGRAALALIEVAVGFLLLFTA
jgi:hypothetical protein